MRRGTWTLDDEDGEDAQYCGALLPRIRPPQGSALSASRFARVVAVLCSSCDGGGGGRRPMLHPSDHYAHPASDWGRQVPLPPAPGSCCTARQQQGRALLTTAEAPTDCDSCYAWSDDAALAREQSVPYALQIPSWADTPARVPPLGAALPRGHAETGGGTTSMREQRAPSIPVPFSRQASLDGVRASPGNFFTPVPAANVGDRLSARRSTSSSHGPGQWQQGRLRAPVLLRRWTAASHDSGDEPRPLSTAVAAAAAVGLPLPRRGDSLSDTDHSCYLGLSQRTKRNSLQAGRYPPLCGRGGGLCSSWGTVESEPSDSDSEIAITTVAAAVHSRESPLLRRTDGGPSTAPAHRARGSRHTTHRPHFLTGAGTPQKSAGSRTALHLSGSDSSNCGEGANSSGRQHSAGGPHSYRTASFAALPPQHTRRSHSSARATPAARRSLHSSARPQAVTGGGRRSSSGSSAVRQSANDGQSLASSALLHPGGRRLCPDGWAHAGIKRVMRSDCSTSSVSSVGINRKNAVTAAGAATAGRALSNSADGLQAARQQGMMPKSAVSARSRRTRNRAASVVFSRHSNAEFELAGDDPGSGSFVLNQLFEEAAILAPPATTDEELLSPLQPPAWQDPVQLLSLPAAAPPIDRAKAKKRSIYRSFFRKQVKAPALLVH